MTKKKNIMHRIITLICILIIIGAGVMIFLNVWPKFKEQKNFEEIQELAIDNTGSEPVIDWDALLAVNPDTVGWITVPGTHIDYPVVQTSDNSWYLTHNFNNEYSGYGTPFLDAVYNPDRIPVAQNQVLYAHSSREGDQIGFQGLNKFEDYAYYAEHPFIYYTTPADGNTPVQYEIVAAIKEHFNYDYRRPDFADQADFLSYYNAIQAVSLYDTGNKVYSNDQMVTLSTCVFDVSNARVAIIARRVDDVDYSAVSERRVEEREESDNNSSSGSSGSSTKKKSNNNSNPSNVSEVLNDPDILENAQGI